MASLEIAFDCRYFVGDRPCVWHKQQGKLCVCDKYEPVEEHVLIVKLDAMGDVLRSTALLPAIRGQHPRAAITWLTRRESVGLLRNNPFVAEILEVGPEALVHLQTRVFDRVINLDASRISCGLAAAARSDRKDGFVLDSKGIVRPTNEAATRWLEAGLFDEIKRSGTATYQERMLAILELSGHEHEYVFELQPREVEAAKAHFQRLRIDPELPIVGLNTGAGGRWPLKQWREDGYVELIARLARQRPETQFVLLGGPGEKERNERLKAASRVPLFDVGCDNEIRHFAGLVAQCHVVVTGDTLAMHLALALKRRLVVVFGPTSSAEIDLYGLGEKVIPNMTCLSCYKTACDFVPNCMDLVSVDMMESATQRQLAAALPQSAWRVR